MILYNKDKNNDLKEQLNSDFGDDRNRAISFKNLENQIMENVEKVFKLVS